ncbi:hypothetical protein [Corynebacterium uterequi]|uniref:Beta-lactamase enzyme family n=1 Tax=Corynebacterium uterequi TaxID=1072256 RepID=A0A0G3HDW1_9CORY|nr:hypothetical protein [Corynebacterium uterequi]AKK10108.1 hypothetical protein CUTER_00395 [Corynebacterium uterequi]
MKKLCALLVALACLVATPVARAATADVPARTQAAIVFEDGRTSLTANAHESRSGLSLVKLYLGYWVLQHGSLHDKARVSEMIRVSHDGIATELDRRYPQAIPSVMRDFQLRDSYYSGYWGSSTTSAYDVARFVTAIRYEPLAAPIIDGMVRAAPIAADGYAQNYGTSTIPGAQGTKFGWSDERTTNATVSFGPGWVIATHTWGSAGLNTADAQVAASELTAPVPEPVAEPALDAAEELSSIADTLAGNLGSADAVTGDVLELLSGR